MAEIKWIEKYKKESRISYGTCSMCNKREAKIKKRQLCWNCYNKVRRQNGPFMQSEGYQMNTQVVNNVEHKREIYFIKNYFKHLNWIYEPAIFKLGDGITYTPDFYDGERGVYIEVAGTKTAYSHNRHKYQRFRELYPNFQLEVRKIDGSILDESTDRKDWSLEE
jgi:hypothetical protein